MLFIFNKFKPYARQTLFFIVAGSSGFIVDAALLFGLMEGLNFHPVVARVFSYLVAVTVTWYINRSYTFIVEKSNRQIIVEWFRYLSAGSAGMLVNFAIYSLLILYAAGIWQNPMVALVISIGIAMFFNFFAYKYFAFSKVGKSESS